MIFNIADLFESVVDAIPDRTALVSGDRRYTYADLDARANRVAHHLLAQGVQPGDHVGLQLHNGHEFLEAMWGAYKIRAVPININYRYVADELLYVYNDADLVVLFHQAELAGEVAAVKDRIRTIRHYVSVGEGGGADASALGSVDYEAAVAAASDQRGFAPRSEDDLLIIYTGGTTGMPKGVMWRHEDVFFAGLQGGNPGGAPISKAEDLADVARNGGLVFMPLAPFIHGAAQWAAIIGHFGGGKVVLCPGRSYSPKRACELVGEEKVNTITLVGDAMLSPLLEELERSGGKYDTSSLMIIASAGAVLSKTNKDKARALLPTTMIINSFGATETGHQGTAMEFGEAQAGPPKFMMNEWNTVLDDDGKPIVPGSGAIGRVARRGRVPLGYYNDPVKTAKTFVTIAGERWSIPGDLATIEADGTIAVFGRGSGCINTGGEKVFPEEVEEALKSHADVRDAVVVGVSDPKWGQKVAAVVAARKGTKINVEDLIAHCRTKIAGYKVPRAVRVVPEVQRHPSGKPDYRWAKSAAEETN